MQVRHAALKVIQLILGQGLVHPVQIVPYLICMSTDFEQVSILLLLLLSASPTSLTLSSFSG